ncbi:UDP-N-acetylmuramoyl-tripeptide--D-alanyl-D-alanine ligase [Verrucomicrobium sp. GAS474]|uniref:UDP-N-acetylmuramoyl-tripeptide--D-alanyl-D- alanine ligase n=1 Tax=Verrucomicrobium sp. GAS474 TaxID=1882831 RepID=UPI000879E31A|nr:UDP-N-acetylmuramoyl-tripeptide--D-alanyl-D-alanine ligase [Verrucomicrobium sp. GAS474]SDU28840.1 UDP-N-acetylmuramoyl-tripeptide--D-alanyl-D-alanine ligase [Verrucomicrobium sp. GAS474]
MEPLRLDEIAKMAEGTLQAGAPGTVVTRLHTDTRTVAPGDAFVSLVGDRFDGHEFVGRAAEAGAVAALVSRRPEGPLPAGFGLVMVPDTLAALQRVASAYRRSHPVRVVGVTGSSGKTSTKEMIAAVLGTRFRTVATEGNLNNHIGVPLTLLRIAGDTEYAVVEMGMNHRGEIASLASFAAPDIGVISNIGSAHIEHLGSREAIADEKTDLLAALAASGAAVLSGGDALLRARAGRVAGKTLWVGEGADAAWRAENVATTTQGISFDLIRTESGERAAVALPLFNRVMVSNALLAAAVGGLAGLSLAEIAAGLSGVRLSGKRMEVSPLGKGWLINDCYNANPESTAAALAALRDFPAPARRVAVIGSMGELGEMAPAFHRETGRIAATASDAALLVFVGPHAADLGAGAREAGFPEAAIVLGGDTAAASLAVPPLLRSDDTLLVKGSRFLKLEGLVGTLQSAFAPPSTP